MFQRIAGLLRAVAEHRWYPLGPALLAAVFVSAFSTSAPRRYLFRAYALVLLILLVAAPLLRRDRVAGFQAFGMLLCVGAYLRDGADGSESAFRGDRRLVSINQTRRGGKQFEVEGRPEGC